MGKWGLFMTLSQYTRRKAEGKEKVFRIDVLLLGLKEITRTYTEIKRMK